MDDGPILRRRLLWLIGLRAVVVTLLLAAATMARVRGLRLPLSVDPFFALAAVTYVLTVAYAFTIPLVSERRWLVDLQLAADALLVSGLVPLMVVLYDSPMPRPLELIGVIALGAAGLSAPGTLYAAMTYQARSRQTLLPLLLFPLVVPVLIAAVKATSLLILGDPMGQVRPWTLLLVAFDAIHWSLCGLLFGRVVED